MIGSKAMNISRNNLNPVNRTGMAGIMSLMNTSTKPVIAGIKSSSAVSAKASNILTTGPASSSVPSMTSNRPPGLTNSSVNLLITGASRSPTAIIRPSSADLNSLMSCAVAFSISRAKSDIAPSEPAIFSCSSTNPSMSPSRVCTAVPPRIPNSSMICAVVAPAVPSWVITSVKDVIPVACIVIVSLSSDRVLASSFSVSFASLLSLRFCACLIAISCIDMSRS